jgi:diacylglycerol kinase (ATP)
MQKSDGNEFARLVKAFGYSFAGLKAACAHPAFRIELVAAVIMVPLAFKLGEDSATRALMIGSVLLVLVVELLNTGIEAAIDRVSTEWHELSKRAKDMGSAAVLVSLLNAALIWGVILWQ